MKKLVSLCIVTGVATLSSMQVSAQSKFEGFYGQVGIGYESVAPSTSSTVTYGGVNIPSSISLSNANSFAGTATLGYTAAVNKDFLMGFGVEYSPIEGQKQNITYNLAGTTVTGGTYNKKNSYNVFVAPGLAVGTDGVAYAKVGFTGATADTGGDTTNYTGYSLGLGYKQIITGGLYGFGEVNYASYGNQTSSQSALVSGRLLTTSVTSSLNSSNLLLGLGYKF
jgi:outer membrane immunogenic protein